MLEYLPELNNASIEDAETALLKIQVIRKLLQAGFTVRYKLVCNQGSQNSIDEVCNPWKDVNLQHWLYEAEPLGANVFKKYRYCWF